MTTSETLLAIIAFIGILLGGGGLIGGLVMYKKLKPDVDKINAETANLRITTAHEAANLVLETAKVTKLQLETSSAARLQESQAWMDLVKTQTGTIEGLNTRLDRHKGHIALLDKENTDLNDKVEHQQLYFEAEIERQKIDFEIVLAERKIAFNKEISELRNDFEDCKKKLVGQGTLNVNIENQSSAK